MSTDSAVTQARELLRNQQPKEAILVLMQRIEELNRQQELREAILALAQHLAQPAPPPQWEYRCLHVQLRPGSEFQHDYWFLSTRDFVPHPGDPHYLVDKEIEDGWESYLDVMGRDGWELVSVLPMHISTAQSTVFDATQTVDFVYHFVLFFRRPKV